MRGLRAWLLRFAGLFGVRRRDADLADELEAHLAMQVEDNLRSGMSPEEARRQALIRLGGATQAMELYRERSGLPQVDTFLQDVRYGARNPGFATLAIITLALGIGANTAIFSVINTVMLRPLPYPDADRLVLMNEMAVDRGRVDMMSVSWRDYLDWRRQARSFQDLGIFRAQNLTLTGVDQPERLNGAMVSADVFSALGIQPLLGRTFVTEEDEAGTPSVAILSEPLWRNRFSASPNVIGRTITLDGMNYTVVGVMPATMRISSPKAQASIKQATPALSPRAGLRPFLVVAEVGLAMVLLVGATLMIRTFSSLTNVPLGFRPEHVVTMRLSLPSRNYSTMQWVTFYRNLLTRVEALPGVQAAGVSSLTPLAGGGSESGIFTEPLPKDPKDHGPGCTFGAVSGGYFDAMGIQLMRGRSFTEHDAAESEPVIIVDEAAVRAFWPGQDPIGRRVAFEFRGQSVVDPQPVWRKVVGVVRTVRHYDLTSPNSRLQVYVPYAQPPFWYATLPAMTLMVRAATSPETLVNAVRQEVASLDPALPVFSVRTMTEYVDGVLEQPRLSMALMASFGGLALLMVVGGIYGVLSYSVSRRTREIGIRMALGASRGQILGFIMREGAMLSMAGVALGGTGALASMRLIRSLLYGVSVTDTATYLLVPVVLLTVALSATFLPARRATRIDPMVALRYE